MYRYMYIYIYPCLGRFSLYSALQTCMFLATHSAGIEEVSRISWSQYIYEEKLDTATLKSCDALGNPAMLYVAHLKPAVVLPIVL